MHVGCWKALFLDFSDADHWAIKYTPFTKSTLFRAIAQWRAAMSTLFFFKEYTLLCIFLGKIVLTFLGELAALFLMSSTDKIFQLYGSP